MEQTQIDSYLSAAVKLLHSSATDSAEKMRNILEAEILKNHDKNQTLSGKLTKKQMADLLQQESKAVGSGFKVKRQKTKKIEDLKIATPPVINENQQIIKIRDDTSDDEDEDASTSAAMLLDDLTCKICRQMDNTANNPLLECTDCNQLYHSVCNNTKIPSDTSTFVCSVCKSKKDKEGSHKSTKSYDSSASSSSSISHKKEKEKEKEIIKEKEIKEIKEVKEKDKESKEKVREKDRKSSSDKKKSESSSSSSRSSKKESTSSRSRSSKK